MGDLARLLGASDFLWEDFIRLQYESLLPMLGLGPEGAASARPRIAPAEARGRGPHRLGAPARAPAVAPARGAADGVETEEAFVAGLNDFKDREIFLYDLDHIVKPARRFPDP